MATQSQGGLLHSVGSIDLLDYILAPVFVLSSVSMTGVGAFTVLGYGFSDVLWSLSGAELTLGFILGALALVAAWVSNRAGDRWDDFDDFESAAIVLGLVSMVGMVFVPVFRELVLGNEVVGIVVVLIHSAAYTVIGYY